MGMQLGGHIPDDHEDSGYRPMAEINITPFVDVMLVLLIIFMVAAPLLIQGVPDSFTFVMKKFRRPHWFLGLRRFAPARATQSSMCALTGRCPMAMSWRSWEGLVTLAMRVFRCCQSHHRMPPPRALLVANQNQVLRR